MRIFCLSICVVVSVLSAPYAYAAPNKKKLISDTANSTASTARWAHPGAEFKTSISTLCSVGFPASDKDSKHYFITALHCFVNNHSVSQGSKVFDYNPRTQRWDVNIGQLLTYIHPDKVKRVIVDAALVEMPPNAVLSGGLMGVPVNIAPIPGWGSSVCARGYRDDHTGCGMIRRPTVKRFDSELGWRSLGFTSDICVLPGDSGGPVWVKGDKPAALGLVQAGNSLQNSCRFFPRSWFTPLIVVMKEFRKVIPSLYLI